MEEAPAEAACRAASCLPSGGHLAQPGPRRHASATPRQASPGQASPRRACLCARSARWSPWPRSIERRDDGSGSAPRAARFYDGSIGLFSFPRAAPIRWLRPRRASAPAPPPLCPAHRLSRKRTVHAEPRRATGLPLSFDCVHGVHACSAPRRWFQLQSRLQKKKKMFSNN